MSITKTEFGGRLTIDYFSLEDLETMLEKMRKEQLAATRTPVPDDYRDETKDAEVSAEVDEEAATLAILARATGIEPVIPSAVAPLSVNDYPATVNEEAVAVSNAGVESIEAVSPHEDTMMKEVVSEMSIPVVAETVRPEPPVILATSEPVSVTTNATAGAKPSLRDQLAALLGNRTSEPVAKVADMPSPVPAMPTTAPVPTPTALATESAKQDTSNDDDLQSGDEVYDLRGSERNSGAVGAAVLSLFWIRETKLASNVATSERSLRGSSHFFDGFAESLCRSQTSVLQFGFELDEFFIDLGAGDMIANFGMDRIGKIDWRCSHRKIDDVAVGGKDEDAVHEEVLTHVGHELATGFFFGVHFANLANPLRDTFLVSNTYSEPINQK